MKPYQRLRIPSGLRVPLSALGHSPQIESLGQPLSRGLGIPWGMQSDGLLASWSKPSRGWWTLSTKQNWWYVSTRSIASKEKPRLLWQRFSTGAPWYTGVPQEFLKPATPDYLVRDTDLFSLRLLNKKVKTANTAIYVWYEWIKIIPILFFTQIGKNHTFWCAQNFSN